MSRAKRRASTILIGLAAAIVVPGGIAAADCTKVGPAKVGAGCKPASSGSTTAPKDPSADGAAWRFLSLTNGERSKGHIRTLGRFPKLEQIALKHAKEMADAGRIYHNPALYDQSTMDAIGNPDEVGENVGRGSDVDSIHSAFMNSAEHRANILERGYVTTGFAVVSANGELWVVETFMSAPHAASSAPVVTFNPREHRVALGIPPVIGRAPEIATAFRWHKTQTTTNAEPEISSAQVLGLKRTIKRASGNSAAGVAIVLVFSVILGAALPRSRNSGEFV